MTTLKALAEYPGYTKGSGLGVVLYTKIGNPFFKGNDPTAQENRRVHFKALHDMKVTWVGLLVSGDDGLETAEFLVNDGFEVVLRPYKFGSLDVCPVSEYEAYIKAGVHYIAPYQNEYDHEAGRPPIPEVIHELARAAWVHADNVYAAGAIPLLPAFEGDRLPTWVLPMLKEMIACNRKDAILGSVLNIHARPGQFYGDDRCGLSHSIRFPFDVEPVQKNGDPGFCVRSYEMWIDQVKSLLNVIGPDGLPWCPPLISTEWGMESTDCRNESDVWSAQNVGMDQMMWLPELMAGLHWEWLNDWGDSHLWRGSVGSSPVVQAMIDMPVPPHPGAWAKPLPVIPFSTWSVDPMLANAARAAAMQAESVFPLLQKDAARYSQCALPTSYEAEFTWQNGIFICQMFGVDKLAFIVVRQKNQYSSGSVARIKRYP